MRLRNQGVCVIAAVALWLAAFLLPASVSADDSVAAHNVRRHVTAQHAGGDLPVPWLWPESEGGHDKCKRFRGYPLPDWCFGLSSWPVLKARAITATVPGIRDGPPHLMRTKWQATTTHLRRTPG